MNAKPATPLPYAVGVTDKQPYALYGPYALRIYAVEPGPEFDFSVAWVRDVDAATLEQNAAYIVQACNAYPQLVAALSKMLANGPGADHGLGAELSARDLLRDLGEAQS